MLPSASKQASSEESLPYEIWNSIIKLLRPLHIRNLSLTCRSQHSHCHNIQLQVEWLCKHRPGRELLAACKVGVGPSTLRALLERPSLYSSYTVAEATGSPYNPTLLINAAYSDSVALVELLLNAGESIEGRGKINNEDLGTLREGRPREVDYSFYHMVRCTTDL